MNAISNTSLQISLPDENATCQLGIDIAMACSTGGLIFLKGDLGAGKTTFARAFIRQMAGNTEMEVPSPTFSILQNYEIENHSHIHEIIHGDLYRINEPEETNELGIETADDNTISLVEWPEKADGALGEPDLTIDLVTINEGTPSESRMANISGSINWIDSVKRSLKIRRFLDDGWGEQVSRKPLMGDASTRSYEFVEKDDQTRILMNAPRQPDGPIIKDGKPYSQIAKLAEDMTAFVGLDLILQDLDLRVPALFHFDLEDGLLLLEFLGSGKIITNERAPIKDRYLVSASLLAEFHEKKHFYSTQIDEKTSYTIPNYDREAMLIEVDLLSQWYAPRFKGSALTQEENEAFVSIWNGLISKLDSSEMKIALRDYHSPNIIWRDNEIGNRKAAVIDFQDAVIGPSAYDLASLAQDARIDVSTELEQELVSYYCELRSIDASFDVEKFAEDYAIMCALRCTKILGIFVRLDERDNKPAYLEHLPRMQDYIKRAMRHPVLAEYKSWYETVMEL